MNVAELIKVINKITPLDFAFDDDKVGLLIGSEENDVSGILIAHDLENAVLEQLDKENINTVITYHPVPMKEVLNDRGEYIEELVGLSIELEKKDINVISLHTAQDVRNNGNADTLVIFKFIRCNNLDSTIF